MRRETKGAAFALIVCDFAGGLYQVGPEWQVLPGLAGATRVIASTVMGIAKSSLKRRLPRRTNQAAQTRTPASSRSLGLLLLLLPRWLAGLLPR